MKNGKWNMENDPGSLPITHFTLPIDKQGKSLSSCLSIGVAMGNG
jgi:hypothetical protein